MEQGRLRILLGDILELNKKSVELSDDISRFEHEELLDASQKGPNGSGKPGRSVNERNGEKSEDGRNESEWMFSKGRREIHKY
ncbi:hypothetical protein C5167_013442 [Papaver somniferum]|uniref:Uncharacterized protein n=1 Tax=Papaver somniferum TaxID=3469 RepID=A0A4Y7J4D9_PAPSO|nr:hypothetical protein C5167_013442 [Papaver somniferum]